MLFVGCVWGFLYLQCLFVQSFDFLHHPLYFLWRDGWDDRVNRGRSDCCLVTRSTLPSLNGTLPQCRQAVFKKTKHVGDEDVVPVWHLWAQCTLLACTTVCTVLYLTCFRVKTCCCLQIKQEVFFLTWTHFLMNIKQGGGGVMSTQTYVHKSYLTENPLSELSWVESVSRGFVKSTAEGSCRSWESEAARQGCMGRERINAWETWQKQHLKLNKTLVIAEPNRRRILQSQMRYK